MILFIIIQAALEDGGSKNKEPGCLEKFGHLFESQLKSFFTSLGTFAAGHPFFVLLPVISITVILASGIMHLEITTNPVELWASPASRSRVEKEYFDKNFEPFYRTEQIIITARGLPLVYHNTSDGLESFGPVFNKEFIQEVMALQDRISQEVRGGNGEKLSDVCFKPLSPSNDNCTVFSFTGYWQNQMANLEKEVAGDNYLDHFKFCSRNPAAPKDSTQLHMSCLGEYGGPIDPSIVLGGFMKPGEQLGQEPAYKDATSVIITFVVNNHYDKEQNREAMEWEKAYVEFMKNWTANGKPEWMEVAFNSERSIEDELERESHGEVSTVLISYLIMFIYISLSLGETTECRRLLVSWSFLS
jgi:Niemann-Pick C1 protein